MNLIISAEAWYKLEVAANVQPNQEISGFGKATRVNDNSDIYVTDIIVPPQEVGGSHVNIDVKNGGMDEAMRMIMERGDTIDQWRLWWHTHGAHGFTKPSPTDTDTLAMLSEQFGGWAAGLVIVADMKDPTAWVDVTSPLNIGGIKMDVKIEGYKNPNFLDDIMSMMDKVKRVAYRTTGNSRASNYALCDCTHAKTSHSTVKGVTGKCNVYNCPCTSFLDATKEVQAAGYGDHAWWGGE